jgi:serine/threonine-protein kinase
MSEGLVLAGRYRLIRKLGQGGMGSVWRAQDMNLGADVAVKLIDAAFAGSPEATMRFKREAQAAAMIRSTHVVQILDHGIDNGTPFIAMELLNGESLAQRLEIAGKLSAAEAGHVLGHAGRALTLAHEHGIVHRDMKPENIFLVREGDEEVGKVLDFGIARQRGGLSDSGGLKTQTGAILGTPYYMSPEQATGQAVDHLTDIWAFGVIASECLTGRRAFDAESLGGLFHAICIKSMPVPSQLGEVPPGFDEWFSRAAAREKSARFQSIKEATAELRAICGGVSGLTTGHMHSSRMADAPASLARSAAASAANKSGNAAPAVFQTTSQPSARSIAESSSRRRSRLAVVVPLVGLTAAAAIYAGWRSRNATDTAAASATIVNSSAPIALASVPPAATQRDTPIQATEQKPAVTVLTDAGLATSTETELERTRARAAVPTVRRSVPSATSKSAVPAAPSKDPLPAPVVNKPRPASPAHEDNAAGI